MEAYEITSSSFEDREQLSEKLYELAQLCVKKHRYDKFVEREDLLQETMLALVPFINAKHIEPISLYAMVDSAMRQALFELNRQSGVGRLGKGDAQLVLHVLRVKENMQRCLNYEPSPADIAREMRIPIDMCKLAYEFIRFKDFLSLNGAIMGDGSSETTLEDCIPNHAEYANTERVVILKSLREQINKVLSSLNGLEETVVRLRFGLYRSSADYRTWEEMNQFEVADELKLLVADVRMLEIAAMRKLRHPIRSSLLEPFLTD